MESSRVESQILGNCKNKGVPRSALFCVFASQNEAATARFCDLLTIVIGNITFDITQVLPSAHYMGFRTQLRLPDRPEEVDVHDVVVNDSLGASVEAKAMPIAASARSHKTPPCIVPMGLACCGPACN